MSADETWIAALRAELEGYLRSGRDDRAAQVVAELKRLGADVETAVDSPAGETAAKPRRRKPAG